MSPYSPFTALLLIVAMFSRVSSSAAQASGVAPEYHVELIALGSGVESSINAPFQINSNDLRVLQGSTPLPFQLHKGDGWRYSKDRYSRFPATGPSGFASLYR
jgi:hypothetical protein